MDVDMVSLSYMQTDKSTIDAKLETNAQIIHMSRYGVLRLYEDDATERGIMCTSDCLTAVHVAVS